MHEAPLVLLAQTPEPMPALGDEAGYFNLAKILFMLLCVFLWAWPAGWISRDARRLSINEFRWGILAAGSGVVGWFCWVIFPSYWLGFLFFAFLSFGGLLTYALYRDSLVEENAKILKPANLIQAIRGEGKEEFEFALKVRLSTLQGKESKVPEEEEEEQLKAYQMLQDLLFDALWRRAGDVFLQPTGDQYRVLFRIDGVVTEHTTYDRKLGQMVVDLTKSAAELDVNERRRPQQAQLVAQQVDVKRKVELDLETSGSTAGERLRIKIRAEEAKFTVEDLGFTAEQLSRIQEQVATMKGLIILAGMGSAGVSTSLYAFARSHDAFTRNIHTVEAKALMPLDNITQNVYEGGTGQSFARLLQSVSRREPDIIMIDPCPDPETMQMIGHLISTKGKKVVTTLRASSTFSAVTRAVRWLGDPNLAADSLLAVTFQRLVRKLCPGCREAYHPNPETLRKLNLPARAGLAFYRPPTQQMVDKKGRPIVCPNCQGSGYLGRSAIFEVLIVDDHLREAIRSGKSNLVQAAARKAGLKYWYEVAMEQVIAGVTSVQEIVRVSKEAEEEAKAKS